MNTSKFLTSCLFSFYNEQGDCEGLGVIPFDIAHVCNNRIEWQPGIIRCNQLIIL